MVEIEVRNELKQIIEETIDTSVNHAFKKYGKTAQSISFIRKILLLLIVIAAVLTGVHFLIENKTIDTVAPVEEHDLTLDNNGVFGFTVVDFEDAILGESIRKKLLVVKEQEAYVNTTVTEAGMFGWGIFSKQQVLTIHGIGQFTIDLSEISAEHIDLNEDTYELTIRIPHATLHKTIFDPSKTEIGDTKHGWLSFGSIKLDAEQQKQFEITAQEKLESKLSEAKCFEEADRFAKLSAYETYQPIVTAVSPAYKVVIEFQEIAQAD